MRLRNSLIALLFVLVACDATNTIPVDTTPAPEPTPTQEYNYWDVSCVPDGVIPVNENPCLSGNPPYGADWIMEPNQNNEGATITPELYEGLWRLWLAGQAGEGFAGRVGVRVNDLALSPGECYAANFVVNDLDLREVPKEEMNNISAQFWVHLRNGQPPIMVSEHAVTVPHGFNFVVDPSPDWFVYFHVSDLLTIDMDFVINQVHRNARMGNHVDIVAVYVHVVESSLCEGIAPIG